MRFLTHELDGRNRLDHVQQRLSGVMVGQLAVAYAGAGARRTERLASSREPSTHPLRRWIRSRVEGLRRR
jgi:hypothetical protein